MLEIPEITYPIPVLSLTVHNSCESGTRIYHETYLFVFIFCQVATERIGHHGPHMARLFCMTISAVVQTANSENLGKVGRHS
jgi:hypothetical protein